MRHLVPVLLALSVLCGDASAEHVPAIVVQDAAAFLRAHPVREKLSSGRTPEDDYAYWFFRGFRDPFGGTSSASDLAGDAHRRGQAYARDHPSERAAIFAGYGYLPVEKTGLWWGGFEVTAFRPDDEDRAAWWMTTFGEMSWDAAGVVPPNAQQGRRNVRVHISGYLSPKGHYGHLGGFAHEVVVMSGGPATGE